MNRSKAPLRTETISDKQLKQDILALFDDNPSAVWNVFQIIRIFKERNSSLKLVKRQANRVLYSLKDENKLQMERREGKPRFSLPGLSESSMELDLDWSPSPPRQQQTDSPPLTKNSQQTDHKEKIKLWVFCDMGTMAAHVLQLNTLQERYRESVRFAFYATASISGNLNLVDNLENIRLTRSEAKGSIPSAMAIDMGMKAEELGDIGQDICFLVLSVNKMLQSITNEVEFFIDFIECHNQMGSVEKIITRFK